MSSKNSRRAPNNPRRELQLAQTKVGELQEKAEQIKEENMHLGSQLFRYDNIKRDEEQLEFLTGLNKESWDSLWELLGIESNKDIYMYGTTEIVSHPPEGKQDRARQWKPLHTVRGIPATPNNGALVV